MRLLLLLQKMAITRLKYQKLLSRLVKIGIRDGYEVDIEMLIELAKDTDTVLELNANLNERYGSNLASGYNKFSGNIGLLHYAVEGMFNSIGPHTKPIGNPCLITGERAMRKSFGQMNSIMPEKMAEMNAVVIWGANPAVTNVHQMKFILQARQKGAKLIVGLFRNMQF